VQCLSLSCGQHTNTFAGDLDKLSYSDGGKAVSDVSQDKISYSDGGKAVSDVSQDKISYSDGGKAVSDVSQRTRFPIVMVVKQ
jgi:hypothetical protein